MNRDALSDTHRARLAYVYIRQSSMHQVQHHHESQRRQRGLVERVLELGWSRQQVTVIDEDLGQSGSRSERRSGFERVLSEVALGWVGIVLALEVSRMSRDNRAWYHLLDICAVTHTLIADGDGLYDPRDYNDRLLLGLKGTISESELHVMKQRLVDAMQAKAARGEFRYRLPPGYLWDEAGRIQKTPDARVCSAVEQIFALFDELGSVNQVQRALFEQGLEVPVRDGRGQSIRWSRPTEGYVRRMLKHPIYAGAYVWGRRGVEESLDDEQRPVKRMREREPKTWPVLLQEHHEGYITWEHYERNQRVIAANRKGVPGPGAAREGTSLLQGLVLCGRCGRKMSVNYLRRRTIRYLCNGGHYQTRTGACQSFGALRLEEAFDGLVLEALQPLGVEVMAAASAAHLVASERQREHWEQRLERARYEAELARRQYDAVDPDNRLVARELERRWECALETCAEVEALASAQLETLEEALSDDELAELQRLTRDLSALWRAATTSPRDKKRVVRCLVENVVVAVPDDEAPLKAEVHWVGGEVTTLEVPKGRRGAHRYANDPEVVELVRVLAEQFADDQIARILHRKRLRTSKGLVFNAQHVTNIRYRNAIAGHTRAKLDPKHVYTAEQAAERLGVSARTVEGWLSSGLLRGSQVTRGAPWRIEITPADLERLRPTAAPDGWVTLKRAALALGVTQQTVLNRLKRGELEGMRVAAGARTAWRIRMDSASYDNQETLFS